MPYLPVLRSALIAGAVLGAMSSPIAASAQELPFEDFFSIQPQTYADVPGVPDPNGCVKLCFRDSSPCDPPLYKKADNRCNNTPRG